jgi:Fe-S-cluster containining protein
MWSNIKAILGSDIYCTICCRDIKKEITVPLFIEGELMQSNNSIYKQIKRMVDDIVVHIKKLGKSTQHSSHIYLHFIKCLSLCFFLSDFPKISYGIFLCRFYMVAVLILFTTRIVQSFNLLLKYNLYEIGVLTVHFYVYQYEYLF